MTYVFETWTSTNTSGTVSWQRLLENLHSSYLADIGHLYTRTILSSLFYRDSESKLEQSAFYIHNLLGTWTSIITQKKPPRIHTH